jgi:uncharacterized protein (DUF342 family)
MFKKSCQRAILIDVFALSDMRFRVKKEKSKTLNEAVRHAVELETFLKAEQRIGVTGPKIRTMGQEESATKLTNVNNSILDLQKSMETIKEELMQLKEKSEKRSTNVDWKKNVECHYCGGEVT